MNKSPIKQLDIYIPAEYLIDVGAIRKLTPEETKLGDILYAKNLNARIYKQPRTINIAKNK